MLVPEMGTSMFSTKLVSCEKEIKELSTLFTSTVDCGVDDYGFTKLLLCFNFSKAYSMDGNWSCTLCFFSFSSHRSLLNSTFSS